MRIILPFATILFFYFFGFIMCNAQIPRFELAAKVGVQVNAPEDVAVDSQGNIYYASTSGPVVKFRYHENLGIEDHTYQPEGLFSESEEFGQYDIALDRYDNLYAVSFTYARVAKYDPAGKLVLVFGSEGEGPGQFKNPEGIAVNSKEEIYVADTGNKRIQKFDSKGKLLQIIPLDPTTGNYFEAPLSIDFDREDNLYLLHTPEKEVVKYSPSGERLLKFGKDTNDTLSMKHPWKLAVDKVTGQVCITDILTWGYYVYSAEGELLRVMSHKSGIPSLSGSKYSIAVMPDGESIVIADKREEGNSQITMYSKLGGEGLYEWGSMWQNMDLTLDQEGNVYLLDFVGKINKFNAQNEYVKTLGDKGIDTFIPAPRAITTDIFNNIYALSNPYFSKQPSSVYKLSPEGNILKKYTDFGSTGNNHKLTDLAVDASGNIYVTDYTGGLVHKISPDGKYSGTVGAPGKGTGKVWLPMAVAVDRLGIVHVLDYNGGRVQQFDLQGNSIRQFGGWTELDSVIMEDSDMALDGQGNVYVASNTHRSRFWIFDSDGDFLHEEMDRKINHLAVDQLGYRLVIDDYQADGYTLYTASTFNTPNGIIKGLVFDDANQNCKYDIGERTLPGVVVMANPGPHYAITEKDGGYTLSVTPGDYTLHTISPAQKGRTITPTCPSAEQGYPVKVSDTNRFLNNVDFANKVFSPPYLSVSVSSDRRRRCFESVTKVTYTNSGFAPASNAKVYLQLPKEVELLSADKAYTRLPNGTYVFDVGTVAAGQSGTITIQDKVTCGDESVRGRTVCTKAWITPANNSTAGPVATVTGKCNPENGMVRFVVRNTGTTAMETGKQFRVYLDGQLTTIENYKLASGDSLVLWIPAGGRTARMEADQPESNGDNTLASATVEACTAGGGSATVSTGFVNALPPDDEEAEVAEECLPIIDSFDPNDKLVTPTGRTEENYTPTGVALKYKIRFQNTGTDVAYRVVVVDTLSEHLDLSTLELGAASHTARFEVSGKGRPVLTWTFDNIMLPDSTTNEPGSHGYIQFSIKPKADLPEKTAVENFADIFFDYNSPVRTNITTNRIYDMPPVINENLRLDPEQIIATPGIDNFAPAAGKYGTEVILTGKKFSATATNNKVYFNGVPATVVSATETELKVLVPTTSATGTIKIETPDGAANTTEAFKVYQPPVISSFTPAEGIVGAEVTLTGLHLNPELIQSIKLGSLACDIISHTSNSLVVRIPAQAASSKFVIETKGGEATSAATYVVWHQPAISSLSKQTDIVGATLSITGQNFAPTVERNKVWFGQTQAQVLKATSEQLTVKVPQGAQSGNVIVETPGGKANSTTYFEVIPGPVFTAMSPAKGSVGTDVEIMGEHFGTLGVQDEITFNGERAIVLDASETKYKVRVPRGATTGKVQIKGIGGVALSTTDFVVEDLTPAQAIEVYPNPTTGKFTIGLLHADFDIESVQVYNAVGKLLQTTTVTRPRPEKLEMNFELARAGMYMLHIKTDRGVVVKKVTVL
ncbi:DUF7619 domain-containing protein [Pontibacter ruber]|uniref:IPT/TIG domain-containing protein n=1 Tax=Pontibacter ruber TaxID=1343895 RepID=A0ABW5CV59_9BACT|nr:IPT/TIG domain-containing protein [Pontibacter ruber]